MLDVTKEETFVPEYTPLGESVYSLLVKKCHHKLSMPALSYFGKEISFGELMNNIDKTSAALTALGVSKGDTVIVSGTLQLRMGLPVVLDSVN